MGIIYVIVVCRELFRTQQLSSHPTIHVNSMEAVQVPFKFSCLEVPPVVSNVFFSMNTNLTFCLAIGQQ